MTMQDFDAGQHAAANRWQYQYETGHSIDMDERFAPEDDLDHSPEEPDDDPELP